MNEFPESWQRLRVALSHDWLTGMRGGERVLEILCEGFPDAPVHTLIHAPRHISDIINRHPIVTSPFQHLPGVSKYYRYLLPFHPWAVTRFCPVPADLLISTSHCVAKGIPVPAGARHLCYCFTPMRYAWTFYDEYFGPNRIKKALLSPVLERLRAWDAAHARHVDRFVAISQHVKRRIKSFYGREADVVYPPVDTDRCTPGEPGHDGYDLIVSALVPYKRVDLAISAYNQSGEPLRIVGTGTEYTKLKAMARPNIQFTGWLSDEGILAQYQRCRMLIFPGEEDFGIVPVEAQACGKPVVAFGRGGVTETVKDGVSGLFFARQEPDALVDAVQRAAQEEWDPVTIRSHAIRFSQQAFVNGLADSIQRCLQ